MRTMTRNLRALPLGLAGALALATAGCDLLTEPETGRRIIGVLEWRSADGLPESAAGREGAAGQPALDIVTIADTVHAGTAVPVTVTTYGLRGCWRADGVSMLLQGTTVTLTPFDVIPTTREMSDLPCNGELTPFPRTVHLLFHGAGTIRLRVVGRRVVDGNLPASEEVTVEKDIVVR